MSITQMSLTCTAALSSSSSSAKNCSIIIQELLKSYPRIFILSQSSAYCLNHLNTIHSNYFGSVESWGEVIYGLLKYDQSLESQLFQLTSTSSLLIFQFNVRSTRMCTSQLSAVWQSCSSKSSAVHTASGTGNHSTQSGAACTSRATVCVGRHIKAATAITCPQM